MPETDFKLNETEDALKKKYLDIINQLSYTELRNFKKKMEYKKLVLSEMRTLFPEYQKNHYDQHNRVMPMVARHVMLACYMCNFEIFYGIWTSIFVIF